MKQLNILATFLFLFFFSNISICQSNKFFQDIGSAIEYGKYSSFLPDYSTYESIGVGMVFGTRYNLIEIKDNVSIGLDPSLVLGLHFGSFSNPGTTSKGYGNLQLPVLGSFNFGAGSTYDTEKNFGIGIAGGFTLHYAPLIGGGDVEGLNRLRIGPSVKLAIRFWKSNSNELTNVFLRADSFSQLEGVGVPKRVIDTKAFFISLGYSQFIDY